MTDVAILYGAKSTTDPHGSIPTQLADGRKLAANRGFEVVDEFQDEAASAFRGNRGPGLAAALAECERLSAEGASCALIVQHSDRLARGDAKEARHLIELVVWAIKTDVQLLSVQDPEMLAGGEMGLLMGVIGGMRNHQDSKRKSLSVRDGMRRRAAKGLHSGGPRPYGYERGAGGILAPLEAEAAVVRRIFAEYLSGRGQRDIARDLNDDSISAQRGGIWHQGTIGRYLSNPLFAGKIRLGDDVHDGQHEALIDAETWEKVRQLREALARTKGRGRGRYPTAQFLFRKGHLRCGSCGEAMIPTTRDRGYEVYACYGRLRNGKDSCPQRPVRRQLVDGSVWDFFVRVAVDVEATKTAVIEQANVKVAEVAALRDQAERDAARAQDRLARIRGDYMDGKLTATNWQEFRDELTAEHDAARAEGDRLTAQHAALAGEIVQIDVEDVVLRELVAIRSLVAGQARDGSLEGIDSFRAALRRLFTSFDLIPASRFRPFYAVDAGTDYMLVPAVSIEQTVDAWRGGDPDFPAVERAALAVHANNTIALIM